MRIRLLEIFILLAVGCVSLWDGVRIIRDNPHVIGAAGSGGWLIFVASLLVVFVGLYAFVPSVAPPVKQSESMTGENLRAVAIAAALLFALVIALPKLGYLISSFLFLVIYIWYFGRYRLPVIMGSAAVACIASAFLWAELGLRVPRGILHWP
jgi:hypothetical protein